MARYIDADEAIRHLRGRCISKYPSSFYCGILSSADEIDKMPIADVVEVKHGKWLTAYEYALKLGTTDEVQLDAVKNDKWWKFCSLCEQQTRFEYNYCPNCGAKMDGGNK